MSRKMKAWIAVGCVVLAALAWIARPWWHGVVMPLNRGMPVVAWWLLTALVAISLIRSDMQNEWHYSHNEHDQIGPLVWPAIWLGATAIVSTGFNVVYTPLIKREIARTTTYTETGQLLDSDRPRLLPFEVAERFGLDSIQEPTVTVGDWQPVMQDGRLTYIAPRVPQGTWRKIFDRPSGIVTVDGEQTARTVKTVTAPMKYGEAMYLARDIRWQIYCREYWIDLPEVFYITVDNQLTACLPVVKWRGGWVRFPYFDGVWLVRADGTMRRLGVEAAKYNADIAKSGRLYPESLARLTAEAYAYRHGVWNTWFGHRDQTEINDVVEGGAGGSLNQQPYYRFTVQGARWTTACEPYGKAFGLRAVIETDMWGQTTVYQPATDPPLTGPAQSVGYVKSALPTYDWATMKPTEPYPLVVDGKLTWRVAITTTDAKGVTLTALVDAASNTVQTSQSDAETVRLLTGQEPATTSPGPANRAAESIPAGDELAQVRAALKESQRLLTEALERLDRLQPTHN